MRKKPLFLAFALALAGCGELSNEDLRFLAILPDDGLKVDEPDEDGKALEISELEQGADGEFDFKGVKKAAEAARNVNAFVHETTANIRFIASHRPSSREDGKRTWGPFGIRNGKAFGLLEITRDPTAKCPGEAEPLAAAFRYRWVFSVATKRDGTFEALVAGVTRGEDFGASCGTMRFDNAVSRKHGGAGKSGDPQWVELGWNRDGSSHDLTVEVDPRAGKDFPLSTLGKYRFRRGLADRVLSLDFVAESDVHLLPARAAAERVATTLRWKGRGAPGRADFAISGGDLATAEDVVVCWNADRQVVYERNPIFPGRNVGASVAACGAFQ